jgi:VanZ family protein
MADLPTAARLRPWAALFRLAFVVTVLTVIGLSLLPGRDLPQVGLSDKLEHVIAYAGMALTGGLAFPRGSAVLRLAILLPLLGIALEFCQLLVPGRSAEVADAVADTIGVLLVVLPFLVLQRVLVRRGG